LKSQQGTKQDVLFITRSCGIHCRAGAILTSQVRVVLAVLVCGEKESTGLVERYETSKVAIVGESDRTRDCVTKMEVGRVYGMCSDTAFKVIFVNSCESPASILEHSTSSQSPDMEILNIFGADGFTNDNIYEVSNVYTSCYSDIEMSYVYDNIAPLDDAYHCAKQIYSHYNITGTNGGCVCSSTKNTCGNVQTIVVNTCVADIMVQVVTSLPAPDYYSVSWNRVPAYVPSSSVNQLVISDVSACSMEVYASPFMSGVVYA